MDHKSYETIVIGGGQAGLATAYYLTKNKVPFIILDENEEVGAAWRKRWKSLRLFTPGRYDSLPGYPFPGPKGYHPGKDDIADYLESYATKFKFPIKGGVRVTKVKPDGDQFEVETQEGLYKTQNVIVATGPFHNPYIPDFASELDPGIFQLHSSEYRSPSQVADGPVLIVGAGQSGAEIALDMARDHEVLISGRHPGEEPAVIGEWSDKLLTPLMAFAANNVINVANPLGRKLRKHFFYPPRGIPRAGGTTKLLNKAGVKNVGRTSGMKDGLPQLDDGRVLHVTNVIWCTGFVRDYSWIDIPHFDEYGFPLHDRGVVEKQPGLYFVGLPFQRTLSSSLLMGVGKDARYIVKHLTKYRTQQSRHSGSPRSSLSAIPG